MSNRIDHDFSSAGPRCSLGYRPRATRLSLLLLPERHLRLVHRCLPYLPRSLLRLHLRTSPFPYCCQPDLESFRPKFLVSIVSSMSAPPSSPIVAPPSTTAPSSTCY